MIQVEGFFHQQSSTISYLVFDDVSKEAAIIDPVLDFDFFSGKTASAFSQKQFARVKDLGLTLVWILETHAHADHLSAAQFWRGHTNARLAIGQGITQVQQTFKQTFNLTELAADGSQFEHLLVEGDTFYLGQYQARVLATPGHTNDSVSYLIDRHVFVGDTLFMPDAGTARCDFPGGDAGVLFDSVQKLYSLADDTQVYVCHDYQPNGRELAYQSSIGEQKQDNIHINQITRRQDFIYQRQQRDKTLAVPRLIYPSLQVNIRGGLLPAAENNGVKYLKLPIS